MAGEREPRYNIALLRLAGPQPLELSLGFPADFVAFIDVSEVDPNKVYVAFNEPLAYVPLSRIITARLPAPVLRRLLFTWDASQEGKRILVYYAGAPGIEIGAQIVTIGGDYIGLLRKQDFDAKIDMSLSDLVSSLRPDRGATTHHKYDIPGGGYVDTDVSGLAGWRKLAVTIRVKYNPNASSGVRVLWLYSPDGTNYDSEEDATALGRYYDVSFSSGTNRIATLEIPVLQPYVRIRVKNLDPSYEAAIDVWTTPLR